MADVPDVYSDHMGLMVGPYGCTLVFSATQVPATSEGSVAATPVATVRMSAEHLMAITFILHRAMQDYRQAARSELSDKALSSLGISRDDWDSFWRRA